jgi:hypothetical protein
MTAITSACSTGLSWKICCVIGSACGCLTAMVAGRDLLPAQPGVRRRPDALPVTMPTSAGVTARSLSAQESAQLAAPVRYAIRSASGVFLALTMMTAALRTEHPGLMALGTWPRAAGWRPDAVEPASSLG